MQSMFKQQLKILQQARVVQNQKLKMVRELYEQFVKVTMSDLRIKGRYFSVLYLKQCITVSGVCLTMTYKNLCASHLSCDIEISLLL